MADDKLIIEVENHRILQEYLKFWKWIANLWHLLTYKKNSA